MILTSDNDDLGTKGSEISVKAGFARNYLVPQKIAVYATEYNRLKYKPEEVEEKEESSTIDYAPFLENLKSQTFNLLRESNPEGTLYGSIRKSEIIEMIENNISNDAVEFKVALEDDASTLTKTGAHEIILELGNGTTTTITVHVDAA